MYASKGRKVSACTRLAIAVSSSTDICDVIDEASIKRTNWLVSAGYTFSNAGQRITCQYTCALLSPRHSAASICPSWMESIPARTISQEYAATLIMSDTRAAPKADTFHPKLAKPKKTRKI